MSIDLDPREVLHYLNELGYYNITSTQLKEFIKDLKKLIKYDLRESERIANKENVQPHSVSKFEELYSANTVSSRAKIVPRKPEAKTTQTTVRKARISPAKEHKQTNLRNESDISSTQSRVESSSTSVKDSEDGDVSPVRNDKRGYISPVHKDVVNEPKPTKPCIKSVTLKASERDLYLKPKASFIRPRKPQKVCKSDPVALYHYYQNEWKRQKLPGEHNYNKLRWAVREKLMGEPEIRPKSAASGVSGGVRKR